MPAKQLTFEEFDSIESSNKYLEFLKKVSKLGKKFGYDVRLTATPVKKVVKNVTKDTVKSVVRDTVKSVSPEAEGAKEIKEAMKEFNQYLETSYPSYGETAADIARVQKELKHARKGETKGATYEKVIQAQKSRYDRLVRETQRLYNRLSNDPEIYNKLHDRTIEEKNQFFAERGLVEGIGWTRPPTRKWSEERLNQQLQKEHVRKDYTKSKIQALLNDQSGRGITDAVKGSKEYYVNLWLKKLLRLPKAAREEFLIKAEKELRDYWNAYKGTEAAYEAAKTDFVEAVYPILHEVLYERSDPWLNLK